MSLPLEDTARDEEPYFWDRLDDGEPQGDEPQPEEADWSGDELEQAYLRAIEVLEASEAELPAADLHGQSLSDAATPPANVQDIAAISNQQFEAVSPLSPAVTESERVEAVKELHQLASRRAPSSFEQPPAVQPRQILEALLFVGGDALTAKKLSGVLRGEFSIEFIERELDELNRLYAAEGRPYEIRLGDGGYRLTLRDEFERIRSKVYGQGPKEVKLSQEAIEVLAVVAYRQPISDREIEQLGKPGCGAILRQLLRRELIAVKRQPGNPRDVSYQTTPRFLSLFGIRSLDELPRHEQVGYK